MKGKAHSMLKETKFKNGFREISLPFHNHEWDFSSITKEEAEFAVFWEYRRDLESYYDGHIKMHPSGKLSYRSAGVADYTGLLWSLNSYLFPLPYLEIKEFLSFPIFNKTKPITEIEPLDMIRIWNNKGDPAWRDIRQFGSIDFWNIITNKAGPLIDRPCSVHCFVINWRDYEKNDIIKQFKIWMKLMQVERKKISVAQNRLSQLGAARAARAGINFRQYFDLRTGKKRRQLGQKTNALDDPKSFSTAAEKAQSELFKISPPDIWPSKDSNK
jgi:hypothetical protein